MFEKFLSANAHDFRQRYEGTYGFFVSENGARRLARLSSVHLDPPRQVGFTDASGMEYVLRADVTTDVGFEFLPPKSAFHNTEAGVYYVERRAARQFQRGITGNNTVIFSVVGEGFIPSRVDFTALTNIFERPLSVEQARERFLSGKCPAIALSPAFCLIAGKEGRVSIYADRAGSFTKTDDGYKVVMRKGFENFTQELRDSFRRSGFTNVEIS